MDQAEINNWMAIAESMEAKGDTESWFYLRARAIADRKPNPLQAVGSRSELDRAAPWRHKKAGCCLQSQPD